MNFFRSRNPTPTLALATFALPAIILLGGLLRFYRLGSKGLWLDEAFSVWMAWQPLADMFGWLLKIDQHPPLYYSLLHLWLIFGDDAATVRAFSAVLSTLTIPVIYSLGRNIGGKQVGLLAAFILALAPFHVRFAQETRMYALLTLNASLAMLAVSYLLTDSRSRTEPIGSQITAFWQTWRNKHRPASAPVTDFRADLAWLTQPLQRRWLPGQAIQTDLAWLGYILFSTATLLSHNTAIFFPIAINLAIIGLFGLRQLGWLPTKNRLNLPSGSNWLKAQVGLALLWSPWLAAFLIQAYGVDREFWISPPDFGTVTWTIKNFLSPFLPGYIQGSWLVWSGYGLLFGLGLWHLRRRPGWLILLLFLIITPIGGQLLVSLRRPLFYDRTLIWATIPLYLLLACGLRALPHRALVVMALLMLMTVNTFSLREYYFVFQKEEWDQAASYVADQVAADDLLLFNATWVQIPFDFYFREHHRTVTKRGAPVDLFDRGVLEPKMTVADVPRLQSLLRDHERVWLIYSHNWYTDPENIVADTLAAELRLLQKRGFVGLEVHLYGPAPASEGRP